MSNSNTTKKRKNENSEKQNMRLVLPMDLTTASILQKRYRSFAHCQKLLV